MIKSTPAEVADDVLRDLRERGIASVEILTVALTECKHGNEFIEIGALVQGERLVTVTDGCDTCAQASRNITTWVST